MLKADAYGHGISGVLPAYETFSDWYAVATVEEGLTARGGTEKPVLLFGPAPEGKMTDAACAGLTFTVGDLAYARALDREMACAGMKAQCHLKIDTGLNRAGVSWRDQASDLEAIKEIAALEHLELTGVYTHFACGDGVQPWETEFTELQFRRYQHALEAMESAGISTGLHHCCATGGAIVHPEYQMDMIRLGMLPMGMSFSEESYDSFSLRPAMEWISFVSQIKYIAAGEGVSYDRTFVAPKPMRIGMVTCGYADGYHRSYSNRTQVLIAGKRAHVLGRIAMDYMMVDLTDIDDAVPGTPVVLMGSSGSDRITALEVARWGDSVCGEVTCSIGQRVPRIYVDK